MDLPPQPGKLLALLVRRPGRLVKREQIREHVWEDSVVEFDQAINNVVRQVRDILGDDASDPGFVATVPRRGYRFVAPVKPDGTEFAAGEPTAGEAVGRRPWTHLAISALVVIAVAIVAWVVGGPTADGTATVVAVVPTRTPVSDSTAEALAASMTAATTSALQGIEDETLEVVPWTADMWYDPSQHAVLRDGRHADVDFAVESTVYAGERPEIAMSLVRFPGGRQVWYRRFEQPANEVPRGVERAAEAVVRVVAENLAASGPGDP